MVPSLAAASSTMPLPHFCARLLPTVADGHLALSFSPLAEWNFDGSSVRVLVSTIRGTLRPGQAAVGRGPGLAALDTDPLFLPDLVAAFHRPTRPPATTRTCTSVLSPSSRTLTEVETTSSSCKSSSRRLGPRPSVSTMRHTSSSRRGSTLLSLRGPRRYCFQTNPPP